MAGLMAIIKRVSFHYMPGRPVEGLSTTKTPAILDGRPLEIGKNREKIFGSAQDRLGKPEPRNFGLRKCHTCTDQQPPGSTCRKAIARLPPRCRQHAAVRCGPAVIWCAVWGAPCRRPPRSRQVGLNFTLRNSMYQYSASSPTCPLGTSQAFQVAVTAPLIHKVICLPLQVTS